MPFRHLILILSMAATPFPMAAQSAAGPATGSIFDSASGIFRRTVGFPGAAMVVPLPAAGSWQDAAVAPGGRWAVAFAANGRVALVRNLLGEPVAVDLRVAFETGRILFNDAADAALLISRDESNAQVFTGLPEAPAPGPVLDWFTEARVKPVALSGGGARLLVSDRHPRGQTLYWTPADRLELHALGRFALVSSVRLSADDADAVVWDGGSGEVYFLPGVFGNTARIPLYHEAGRADRILEVGFTRGKVIVAGAAGLLAFERSNPAVTSTLQVPMAPTRWERIGDDLILLTAPGAPPLYVVDAAGELRISFIPSGVSDAPK